MNLHELSGNRILSKFWGTYPNVVLSLIMPKEAVEAAKQLTEETGTGWHDL